MPYKMEWLIEGRVALMVMEGDLTMEEVPLHNEAYTQYIEAGTASLVHIIAETSGLRSFPLNVFKLRKLLPAFDHPDLGWFVIVSHNKLISQIGSLLATMQKQNRNRIIGGTVSDAIEFLKEVDSTIDWTELDSEALPSK